MPDISNKTLFGRLSIEGIAAVIVFTFGTGGAWYALAGDVEENRRTVQEVKKAQGVISRDVSEIKQDISGIKASQSYLARDVERILTILEKQPRADR